MNRTTAYTSIKVITLTVTLSLFISCDEPIESTLPPLDDTLYVCNFSVIGKADFREEYPGDPPSEIIADGALLYSLLRSELAIFAISAPAGVKLVAGVPEEYNDRFYLDMEIRNGYLYLLSMFDLFVYDHRDQTTDPVQSAAISFSPEPESFESEPVPSYCHMVIDNDRIIVGPCHSDARNVEEPAPLLVFPIEDDLPVAEDVTEVDIEGGHLEVFAMRDGFLFGELIGDSYAETSCLKVMDLRSAEAPVDLGCYDLPSPAESLLIDGSRLYVGLEDAGTDELIRVFDISNPEALSEVAGYFDTLRHSSTVHSMAVNDEWLYLVASNAMYVYDTTGDHELPFDSFEPFPEDYKSLALNRRADDRAVYIRTNRDITVLSQCPGSVD